MASKRWNGPSNDPSQVKPPKTTQRRPCEFNSHGLAELIEHVHVEQQMHPIGMHKGMGKHPVNLAMVPHAIRDKHPARLPRLVHQSPRDQGGQADHQRCRIHEL